MSFDDELKQRMKQAAERAASQADPAKAAARLSAVTSSGTLVTGTVLKVIGGLGALGLATGAVLGVTVLEDDSPAAAAAVVDIDVQQGRTFDCPDGTPVGALQPGDRVYVVGRDEGGNWAALRDPGALGHMVWVPMASCDPTASPPKCRSRRATSRHQQA